VFDETEVDTMEAAADGTLHVDIPTVKVGPLDAPGCVTAIVLDTAGDPDVVVTVTRPILGEDVVFSVADRVTVPFPVPALGDTVNHAWFDDADQLTFEVTWTLSVSGKEDPNDQEVALNSKDGPGGRPSPG